MIAQTKVVEVEALLALGIFSQRSIARQTGVSRATISQIASGERPDYAEQAQLRAHLDEPLGPIARCKSCGGLVRMPCRLCRARKFKEQIGSAPIANRRPLRSVKLRKVS